ncbi:MAG: flavodoxin [Lachnospiraceae bacterium]|nr:flavodoxin [Lachnospiraceae bacterium]
MKKIVVILLTVMMVFSLAGCGGEKKTEEERPADTGNTTEAAPTENDSAENTLPEVTPEPESTLPEVTSEPESNEDTPEITTENGQADEKILVVYFSATNTTEGVAEIIADSLSADIYEIVPEQPYTDADLDYNDDNSRSTIEMNDSSARPAISGSVENMEQYSIVFIGYPIWWGQAPKIVSTFMESYDFTGKTIVPFCTSGSSGVGSSATNLEELTDGAIWLSGTRLDGGSSHETIVEWVNGLGLDIEAE